MTKKREPRRNATAKPIAKVHQDTVAQKRNWIYAGAIAAVVILVFWAYAPCLRGAFLFDDAVLPFALPGASAPLAIWLRGVRPVLMASYWLNSRISGDESTYSYHIFNVLIHLATTGLIFLIARRLLEWSRIDRLRRDVLAAFAAALFLLHPIQSESVA